MRVIVRRTTFAATLALVGCADGPPSLDGGSIATVPAKGKVMLASGKPLTERHHHARAPARRRQHQPGHRRDPGRRELRAPIERQRDRGDARQVSREDRDHAAKVKIRPGKEPEVEVKEGQDLEVKLP